MKIFDYVWLVINTEDNFASKWFQDVEQALSTENKKEQDVVAVRLENIKLKNKLKKKEHQLKSKVISSWIVHHELGLIHLQLNLSNTKPGYSVSLWIPILIFIPNYLFFLCSLHCEIDILCNPTQKFYTSFWIRQVLLCYFCHYFSWKLGLCAFKYVIRICHYFTGRTCRRFTFNWFWTTENWKPDLQWENWRKKWGQFLFCVQSYINVPCVQFIRVLISFQSKMLTLMNWYVWILRFSRRKFWN